MGKYQADEVSEQAIQFSTELGKVVRDELGVLRASTFTIDVCACCGAMNLLMLDAAGCRSPAMRRTSRRS